MAALSDACWSLHERQIAPVASSCAGRPCALDGSAAVVALPVVSAVHELETVRQLLASWSLEQYLRTRPPCHVVTLDVSMTIGQTLKLLATHNVLSAPLFDNVTNEYLGFVDMNDLVRCLLEVVNIRELTEETRSYKLRTAGIRLEHQQLRNIRQGGDGALIYKADMSCNLLEMIVHGFLGGTSGQTHHRVGVFEMDDDSTDDQDSEASSSRTHCGRGVCVTSVVSQSDVLRFLSRHARALGPAVACTLEQLGLAHKPVVCVSAHMPAIHAFATMHAHKVSGVGVVSPAAGGALAANLSCSDLRGLLPQQFTLLALPVLQFLSAKAALAWPPHTAHAPANQYGLKGAELLRCAEVLTVQPCSTLSEALLTMAERHVHRLYVVDDAGRPVGVVTATDVLRLVAAQDLRVLAATQADDMITDGGG